MKYMERSRKYLEGGMEVEKTRKPLRSYSVWWGLEGIKSWDDSVSGGVNIRPRQIDYQTKFHTHFHVRW